MGRGVLDPFDVPPQAAQQDGDSPDRMFALSTLPELCRTCIEAQ